MSLSNYERETIIVFSDADDTATMYTCNKAWKSKLSKLLESTSAMELKAEDEESQTYIIPKKWVKVKQPRQMSEGQKDILRERMRSLHASKKVL